METKQEVKLEVKPEVKPEKVMEVEKKVEEEQKKEVEVISLSSLEKPSVALNNLKLMFEKGETKVMKILLISFSHLHLT